jgi:hypothetical protein
MQIAFDLPPGGVGGGDDPRPGCVQRGLGRCVGDRGRDELGESGQSLLGADRKR